MKRAAIFDLDGTLIDTPNAIVGMMGIALGEMGIAPVPEDRIRATIGLPLETGAAQILGKRVDHPDVAQLVTRYRRQFLDWMVPRSAELIFPGVASGLQRLRDSGVLLGVATSKYTRSAEAVLRAAGLRELFSAVIGADDVRKPKPDREMALVVADKLDADAPECVVIGDTVHDLRMAKAAGMRGIAVTYGVGQIQDLRDESPDWIAEDFPETVSILLAHGGRGKDAAQLQIERTDR
jgi:2-phosphoglycolate phosphatase